MTFCGHVFCWHCLLMHYEKCKYLYKFSPESQFVSCLQLDIWNLGAQNLLNFIFAASFSGGKSQAKTENEKDWWENHIRSWNFSIINCLLEYCPNEKLYKSIQICLITRIDPQRDEKKRRPIDAEIPFKSSLKKSIKNRLAQKVNSIVKEPSLQTTQTLKLCQWSPLPNFTRIIVSKW